MRVTAPRRSHTSIPTFWFGRRRGGSRLSGTGAEGHVVPNTIAAVLLHLCDATGRPHCYFGWAEGNPLVYLLRCVLFGEGDTAPVVHEALGAVEKDPKRRHAVRLGGQRSVGGTGLLPGGPEGRTGPLDPLRALPPPGRGRDRRIDGFFARRSPRAVFLGRFVGMLQTYAALFPGSGWTPSYRVRPHRALRADSHAPFRRSLRSTDTFATDRRFDAAVTRWLARGASRSADPPAGRGPEA